MKWKNKKVLVTGAGGFIGSHLVEELVIAGAEVVGLVHYNSRDDEGNLKFVDNGVKSELKVVKGDICDFANVLGLAKSVHVIFHLAALIGIPYSYSAPQSYVNTNILGTFNVLQASLEAGVEKIVHTSTSEVYGSARYIPIDENHSLAAQSPYSATKIAADKLAESFNLTYGLPVATIRPFNTFGPRQSARAVIPAILSQLFSGNGQIRIGSMTPIRDFTYVKDTVKGFMAVGESEKTIGEVTNIGTGKGIKIGQIVKKCLALTGKKAEIIADDFRVRPKTSEVTTLICNYDKAKKNIEWEPKYSFNRGLSETADFIRNHLNSYNPDKYTT